MEAFEGKSKNSGERQKCRKASLEVAKKGEVCSLDGRRKRGKKEA